MKGESFSGRSAQPGKWRILLAHPSAWGSLGLIVLHQSIVASSTYFLTLVITRFHAGSDYTDSLYLYLASMVTPYLPGCLSLYAMQRWINSAHAELVTVFSAKLRDRTEIFRNSVLAERVGSALSSNALPVLRDYVSYLHDLTSFTLNSVLSMLVIGLLLPPQLLVGFVASMVLCTLLILALRNRVATASTGYERSYMQYASVLDRAWENLTLGNQHNEALWQERLVTAGASFYRNAERLQAVRQGGNAILAAASLLPTVYLIIEVARGGQAAPGVTAAIIVSLTRIFLILNSLSAVVYKALDISSVHSRFLVLLDTASAIPTVEDLPGCLAGTVQINGVPVTGTEQAVEIVRAAERGRITITGANGSGKSTVLLTLKKRFKEKAFLLPTQHNRLVWKSDLTSLSSGERTKASIFELLQMDGVRMLLLDEWDANLDPSNRQAVDRMLDQVSMNRIIVEVRH
jgi:ABC-type multidrug transport system fused ATPase/permease subunit